MSAGGHGIEADVAFGVAARYTADRGYKELLFRTVQSLSFSGYLFCFVLLYCA